MTTGYVYVLKTKAFKYLKIGHTTKNPKERAADLFGTGLPHPYKVVYSVAVADCRALERQIHEHFADQRVSPKREFFAVTVAEAIAAIENFIWQPHVPEPPVTPTQEWYGRSLRLPHHRTPAMHNTHIPTNRYAEEILEGPANLSLSTYYPRLSALLHPDDDLYEHIPGNFGRLEYLHRSHPEYLAQAERTIKTLIKVGYELNYDEVPRTFILEDNEIKVPLYKPGSTEPVWFVVGSGV